MNSMQRQFGKLMNKAPGDNAKVSVILKDYEDADALIAKIIESCKSWKESWIALLNSQLAVATEYQSLYDPIVGASDGHGRDTAPTPDEQLRRTFALHAAYEELKTDLMDEVVSIEVRILRPATDARDCLAPIRKTIKKRENKRVDYETRQDKVTKLQRKAGRSAKEDAALARAEEDLRNVAEEFHIADDHLRATLPPIVDAAFRIVSPLLSALVLVQNRLLGLYYTVLHGYCQEHGFPSPPPPMDDVIAQWSAKFKPAQRDVESMGFIVRGRSIHGPPSVGSVTGEGQGGPPSSSTFNAGEAFRRSSSGLIPGMKNAATGLSASARTLRIPSGGSLPGARTPPPPASSVPDRSTQPSPRIPSGGGGYAAHLRPTEFTTASGVSPGRSRSPRTPSPGASAGISPLTRRKSDYFAPQNSSYTTQAVASIGGSLAKKKAPPPPPPPKRIPSTRPDEFVIALYTFDGQNDGDLSFREGDRIKIVKRTNTDQDWWTGELPGGMRGTFPANYCRGA